MDNFEVLVLLPPYKNPPNIGYIFKESHIPYFAYGKHFYFITCGLSLWLWWDITVQFSSNCTVQRNSFRSCFWRLKHRNNFINAILFYLTVHLNKPKFLMTIRIICIEFNLPPLSMWKCHLPFCKSEQVF